MFVLLINTYAFVSEVFHDFLDMAMDDDDWAVWIMAITEFEIEDSQLVSMQHDDSVFI